MQWLAATNLMPDSFGVLELSAWISANLRDRSRDAFAALSIARDADYFTATSATRAMIAERLAVALRESIEGSAARGVFSRTHTRSATSVAAALSEAARADKAILILGRRAERESRRLVRLGAVARRVIRRLSTPVVVAPADWSGEHAGSGPIVVAVDPTEPSLSALAFGERLAAALGRSVALVHALPGIEDLGVAYLASSRALELRREHTAAATDALHAFLTTHGHGSIPSHAISGPPVETILEVAADLDALMIVTGSRRLAIGERLLSASVGSELAAMAPVPVAIVPPDFSA